MSDDHWIERAQSAEARVATLQDQYGPALDRVKQFKANFGVKEKTDGSIVVDYEKFARGIGIEGALELRAVIDEMYSNQRCGGRETAHSLKWFGGLREGEHGWLIAETGVTRTDEKGDTA